MCTHQTSCHMTYAGLCINQIAMECYNDPFVSDDEDRMPDDTDYAVAGTISTVVLGFNAFIMYLLSCNLHPGH